MPATPPLALLDRCWDRCWTAGGHRALVTTAWWLTVGNCGVKWRTVEADGGLKGPFGLDDGRRGVFLGTYAPRLDEKGRLTLPAKFRDELAGGLVITRGQERCLYVFTTEQFTRMAEQVAQTPVTAKSARDYGRVLFSGADDQVPDKQGRITVPPHLRRYAGLERECTVIGASTRLEIWDTEAWESYLQAHEQEFSDISEEVLPALS
jgi:MraZ protein